MVLVASAIIAYEDIRPVYVLTSYAQEHEGTEKLSRFNFSKFLRYSQALLMGGVYVVTTVFS